MVQYSWRDSLSLQRFSNLSDEPFTKTSRESFWMRLRLISGKIKKCLKPTEATLTKLCEVVDVAPEEGQLATADVHELVVKRVHHSLVQVELLHGVASVKGTFKGTIESESERNGKYFQTVKKISKHYHSQTLPTLAQLEEAT